MPPIGSTNSGDRPEPVPGPLFITEIRDGEGVCQYVRRLGEGRFDHGLYRRLIGAANEFKDGDLAAGVSAGDQQSRLLARRVLAATKLRDLHETPLFRDAVQALIWDDVEPGVYRAIEDWSLDQLKKLLLSCREQDIKGIMPGLDSDAIACVVKLLSNEELIKVGQSVFNALPGSSIGSRGYLGARIQPNSPVDHPEDVAWQVFDAFSYAVGDVVLGTNPVDSAPQSVATLELALRDIVESFGLQGKLPWNVLAHIDVQAEVERRLPGSTALFFQSIAGVESANRTFDISIDKMMAYAAGRTGQYGLYFETGQGADFTNGHGHGFDMLVHESRKYGFARALAHTIASVRGEGRDAWVILNDVAGFIGPEVFRCKEQLVRTCLEDIVMGKLHGLTIGLDICTTLHMSVSLDDLEWSQDQIMPANPAYLMALPTRNDPMLSYLSTSFQDHVRIREKFGYRVNDVMWEFFGKIGVIGEDGRPSRHFGDPLWVYYQYRLHKGDKRAKAEIAQEGRRALEAVRSRGVPIAVGHGARLWDLDPALGEQLHALYEDAKKCIWTELTPEFIGEIPDAVVLASISRNRDHYIGHPAGGESTDAAATQLLQALSAQRRSGGLDPDVQIVVSDGLNARALMDEGHLLPFLRALRAELQRRGLRAARENLVVLGGRVRVGYRIGELLFADHGDRESHKAVIHVIGERPGNGHRTFSAYIAAPRVAVWGREGSVDHNLAKLVSGISDTSLLPEAAAVETVKLLLEIIGRDLETPIA